MKATDTLAQRLGRVLERLTHQSGRLPEKETPEFGSWLLGGPAENPRRRRVRIQVILTVFIALINILGIAFVGLLVVVGIPEPNVIDDAPRWITYGLVPCYIVTALILGTWWITQRIANTLRWAIDGRRPNATDHQNTFLAPWRIAFVHLVLWGIAIILTATAYGLHNPVFIPRFVLVLGIVGAMVATFSYLATEFTLRPVAAQALEAGPAPRRIAPGIMGRLMTVWMLSSGLPIVGIGLLALFVLLLGNLSRTQFAVAVLICATATVIAGFILVWIAAWITVTPVRVVRTALKRVEDGDLSGSLLIFDGTELGELQRGFNSMVAGLRERERVRDLFGRHVGREVAAAAEATRIKLGGEERHAAVVFVDIIGSTKLVTSRPAAEVVETLNRFFAVVVNEVDKHDGLLNKFEGDACLAVFGAPNDLPNPEDAALGAARAIAQRLRTEIPECDAGIGVAAGQVIAGNVGARERFEYTVIGEPVNEAARLCELSKSVPSHLLASSDTIRGASETESALWVFGETVTLRGHVTPTLLASPA